MAHPAVSIGLLLPTREVVMAEGAHDLSKIIDLAVRAEELGFDSVWVGDHMLFPGHPTSLFPAGGPIPEHYAHFLICRVDSENLVTLP